MSELKDGKIEIDLRSILESMTGDSKMELIKFLACEEEVIERVSQQLIHGCTDDGWSGSTGCGINAYAALDKAKREIASNTADIVKREIERLVACGNRFEQQLNKAQEDLFKALNPRSYHE